MQPHSAASLFEASKDTTQRRGSDFSYPVVARPGLHRILRKEGVNENQTPGLVSGGVYPWIPKEVYDVKADKHRVQLIVNAIKSRRDIEFKELADKLIVPEQTLEQKVLQRRGANADQSTRVASGPKNRDHRVTLSLDPHQHASPVVPKHDMKTKKLVLPAKRMGLLPLGFGHLRIPFGGKNYQTKRSDTNQELKKTFDPVDCSLLLEDHKGIEEAKKLKKRVQKLDKERAQRYLVSMGISKAIPPGLSSDAIQREKEYRAKKDSLLNPHVVDQLAKNAVNNLSQNNPIFWSMDAKVDFEKLSSSIEKPSQKAKPHRGNVLFELLKHPSPSGLKKTNFQSNTDRDLKMDRGDRLAYDSNQLRKSAADAGPYATGSQLLTTKSLSSLGNTLQAYQTTLAEGSGRAPRSKPNSLRFQLVDIRASQDSEPKPAKVDVTRLPYLYISPSI